MRHADESTEGPACPRFALTKKWQCLQCARDRRQNPDLEDQCRCEKEAEDCAIHQGDCTKNHGRLAIM